MPKLMIQEKSYSQKPMSGGKSGCEMNTQKNSMLYHDRKLGNEKLRRTSFLKLQSGYALLPFQKTRKAHIFKYTGCKNEAS